MGHLYNCLHCNTYRNKPPPVALGLPRGFWMISLSSHDPVQTIPLSDSCKHHFKTDDKFQHVKLNLTLPELTPIGVTWPQLTHLHNKHSFFTTRIKTLYLLTILRIKSVWLSNLFKILWSYFGAQVNNTWIYDLCHAKQWHTYIVF